MDTEELYEFHVCCYMVISAACKAPNNQNLQYGATYAKAGLRMDTEELIIGQIPYILCNLQYWRGERAREVKDALKRITKERKLERC